MFLADTSFIVSPFAKTPCAAHGRRLFSSTQGQLWTTAAAFTEASHLIGDFRRRQNPGRLPFSARPGKGKTHAGRPARKIRAGNGFCGRHPRPRQRTVPSSKWSPTTAISTGIAATATRNCPSSGFRNEQPQAAAGNAALSRPRPIDDGGGRKGTRSVFLICDLTATLMIASLSSRSKRILCLTYHFSSRGKQIRRAYPRGGSVQRPRLQH